MSKKIEDHHSVVMKMKKALKGKDSNQEENSGEGTKVKEGATHEETSEETLM